MSRLESNPSGIVAIKEVAQRAVQITLLTTAIASSAQLEAQPVFAQDSTTESPLDDLGSSRKDAKEFCEREVAPSLIPIFDTQELGSRSVRDCLRSLV